MRIIKSMHLMILLASLLVLAGCSKDDETSESPYVGNYVISKAEVSTAFDISTTTPGISIPVPANTDITAAVQTALLGAVTCTSADKTYIELRKDKAMYLSCEGDDLLNAGTWEEISSSSLKLNMNSTAIPSSPSGFSLTVSNLSMNGNALIGTTSVPMPKEMFADMVAANQLTIADTPPIYMVTFTIELTKK